MKKFLGKMGKVLKCRWLWSALGIAWVLYLGLGIYGGGCCTKKSFE